MKYHYNQSTVILCYLSSLVVPVVTQRIANEQPGAAATSSPPAIDHGDVLQGEPEMSGLPGLVNCNKKRWKDPPFLMEKPWKNQRKMVIYMERSTIL
jgi:hypothetical protein